MQMERDERTDSGGNVQSVHALPCRFSAFSRNRITAPLSRFLEIWRSRATQLVSTARQKWCRLLLALALPPFAS